MLAAVCVSGIVAHRRYQFFLCAPQFVNWLVWQYGGHFTYYFQGRATIDYSANIQTTAMWVMKIVTSRLEAPLGVSRRNVRQDLRPVVVSSMTAMELEETVDLSHRRSVVGLIRPAARHKVP